MPILGSNLGSKSAKMNMKYLKLLDENWEIGSNTFADLGLENAERLHAKTDRRVAMLFTRGQKRLSRAITNHGDVREQPN